MLYIYILKLEGNKYYVGKTTNPDSRFKSHIESSGSSWTTKYPPIKQLKIIPNCDKYDEHKYTIKYMEKYGIDNVRGASYCRVKLTDEEKRDIKRQIDGATDVCHKCGIQDISYVIVLLTNQYQLRLLINLYHTQKFKSKIHG